MTKQSLVSIPLIIILALPLTSHCFSFNSWIEQTKTKLRSVFAPSNHTQVVQKDIKKTTQKTLVVENMHGSVKIKTDWNQDTISVKAVKTASEENLQKISIIMDAKNPDTITLKTVYSQPDVAGTVDYTLMVPKNMTVRLKTAHGNIRVKRFDGHIWATTDSGTIEIAHVSQTITAMINEWGSISIDQCKGSINAFTHNGTIEINKALGSVVASTDKGNILFDAQEIPSTSSIELDAAGTLVVYLPEETNAHVRAQTLSGKITSEHTITLASQTTKLNDQTWAQLRRNIEGTIGTGEAEISLASQNGSIKILATEVA